MNDKKTHKCSSKNSGKKINEHKGSLPKRLNYNKEPNRNFRAEQFNE